MVSVIVIIYSECLKYSSIASWIVLRIVCFCKPCTMLYRFLFRMVNKYSAMITVYLIDRLVNINVGGCVVTVILAVFIGVFDVNG